MKINAIHIGKKVQANDGTVYTVLFVGQENFFGTTVGGEEHILVLEPGYWQWKLIEEPKPLQKPSERINTVIHHLEVEKRSEYSGEIHAQAIGRYLDEIIPKLDERLKALEKK